jgi:hypothetical protein
LTVRHRALLVLTLATVAAAAPTVRAGFTIVDQSVNVDAARGRAAFALRFDARPDFRSVDEFDRLANSFQYEIDADATALPGDLSLRGVDAVVRGDEIRFADALRIRSGIARGEIDPDPAAGAWGPVRATVPFQLEGERLSFEVPLSAIADDDGRFAYRVFSTEFGLTTSEITAGANLAAVVPLPAAIWAGGAMLAALALVRAARTACARPAPLSLAG